MSDQLQVYGALIQGFAEACINLKIIADDNIKKIFDEIIITSWYPIEDWKKLQEFVTTTYSNAAPIMERVGMEMMFGWYHYGPGKNFIQNGISFLQFQTSSDGYYSVIKGSPEQIGEFNLVEINKNKGTAIVYSTTPFNRDMERGVLIGGMKAPGDLNFIDVDNRKDPDYFVIRFH